MINIARLVLGITLAVAAIASMKPVLELQAGPGEIAPDLATEAPSEPLMTSPRTAPTTLERVENTTEGDSTRLALEAERVHGEIHLGDLHDYTRFRGTGHLEVQLDDQSAALNVPVENGKFSFVAYAPGPIRIVGAQLSALTQAILAPEQNLESGKQNIVHCQWDERVVEMSIKSGESGEHLDRLQVLRVASPSRRVIDPGFGGEVEIAPSPEDEPMMRRAQSPLLLTIGPAEPGQFWIVRDGYVPFRYRYPEGQPTDQVTIHLTPESALEVWIDGELGDLADYVLTLYERFEGVDYPTGAPLFQEHDVTLPTRIAEIPPGSYSLALELITPAHSERVVVAHAVVELEHGQSQEVRLTAVDPLEALETGEVTFQFPVRSGEEGVQQMARIVPLTLNASRMSGRGMLEAKSVAPGMEWGPLSLLPGDYYLLREPDRVTHFFRVEPGSRERLQVPAYDVPQSFLTILDARSEEAITPATVSMWTSMKWNGECDPEHRFELRSLGGGQSPLPIKVPLGEAQVTVVTRTHGLRTAGIELLDGVDPVLVLEPPTRIEVVLDGLDEPLSLHWLSAIDVRQQGQRIRSGPPQAIVEDGTVNTGWLSLDAVGEATIRFPLLPSYGSVKQRTITLARGETASVHIGVGDFDR